MIIDSLELVSLGVAVPGGGTSLAPTRAHVGVGLVLERADNAGADVVGDVAVDETAEVGEGFG